MYQDFERRQITVMFCELVDSVSLFEKIGATDFAQLIEYQRIKCSQQVHDFGGEVAYFQGDSMLACFGHLTPHPDDPERGVRAAIGILDVAQKNILSARTEGIPQLKVRIGIDTGPAVVGHSHHFDGSEYLEIFGRPLNVAARLLSLAESNQIIASEMTKSFANQKIQFRKIGSQIVEGVPRRFSTFEIV